MDSTVRNPNLIKISRTRITRGKQKKKSQMNAATNAQGDNSFDLRMKQINTTKY